VSIFAVILPFHFQLQLTE